MRSRHGNVRRGLDGALPLLEARGTAEGCARACLELEAWEEVLEELLLEGLDAGARALNGFSSLLTFDFL